MRHSTILRTLAALVAAAFLTTACAQGDRPGTKQSVGAVGGAILGGLAGAQFGKGTGKLIATGTGAVLGAFLGSELGKSLDRADKVYMARTTQASLEHTQTGATSSWQNPDSGHSGTVTPTETYQRTDGTYCREFQQTVTIGGERESAYGTACRQPDGSWQIVQ
jgi:surface antigen